MIKIKFCTRCELEQPIEDFIKDGKEFKTCIKCRNIGKIVSINHRLNIREKIKNHNNKDTQICCDCGIEKQNIFFINDKNEKLETCNTCILRHAKKYKQNQEKLKNKIEIEKTDTHKVCIKCKNKHKLFDFFTEDKEYKTCIECRSNDNKDHKNKIIEINYFNSKNEEIKICPECQNKKSIDCFKDSKGIIRKRCNKCREEDKEFNNKLRKENPDKHNDYRKQNYINRLIRLQNGNIEDYIDYICQIMYNSAKQRSKNIEFNLTKEYLKSIYPKDNKCPILNEYFKIADSTKEMTPSLDKIDPNQNYLKHNVQIISFKANRVKSNASLTELLRLLCYLKNRIPIENINTNFPRKIIKIQKNIIIRTKTRAKKRNIVFNIDLDYIQSIYPKDNKCPITNRTFTSDKNNKGLSASIDRIDPNLGYIKGNIQIISFRYNLIKNNFSIEELERTIKGFQNLFDLTGTGIIPF